MYKGYDCIDVAINNNNEIEYNEIEHYLSHRYVSASEACYRLLEFDMHSRSHNIIHLAVHLPLEQNIYFHHGKENEALTNSNETTLTAWFDLNKNNPEARKYKYCDIPKHYRFCNKTKSWLKRKYNGNITFLTYTGET